MTSVFEKTSNFVAKNYIITLTPDKPEFVNVADVSEEKVFTVEEGKSIMIELPAKANPAEIEYKWTSPGRGNIPEPSGTTTTES
jgi:hypothetical protein